ncbi:hypothetical protein SAMN02745885_00640 [Carboxydocella sporoproducens DSM 16521]|uniref:Bacterial Ig-like domain-containing protein n=2 Tax=Carboxydocella TaxID=178898 RepID=A0A1T4MKT8_9FIRM|nr:MULTISPECIES: hypothetical protein [Carboxydocella]AVX21374.1 hypothetical protein CFE_2231 [Carboxydocella thermautotrophica]SJZ67612.1 hypothetical protein SAMN02745885_00640 [Carboxydocella sporoproducens DSM 16521]
MIKLSRLVSLALIILLSFFIMLPFGLAEETVPEAVYEQVYQEKQGVPQDVPQEPSQEVNQDVYAEESVPVATDELLVKTEPEISQSGVDRFVAVTGGAINASNVTDVEIYGFAEPNSSVEVEVYGVSLGFVATDAEGFFSEKFDLAFCPDGITQVKAIASTGQVLSTNVLKDTVAPAYPPLPLWIAEVEDKEILGKIPLIFGVLPPGWGLDWERVQIKTETGDLLMEGVVDFIGGVWWARPAQPLPEGNYRLTAILIDHAGNCSVPSRTFDIYIGEQRVTLSD